MAFQRGKEFDFRDGTVIRVSVSGEHPKTERRYRAAIEAVQMAFAPPEASDRLGIEDDPAPPRDVDIGESGPS